MTLGFALATPSYRGDLERCALLCRSVDRFVDGHAVHYLLVEDRDVALFRPLEGPRRRVVAESELLPGWLRSWPDPLHLGRRRFWTGLGALRRGIPPLRGWHSQQLRKLALPLKATEDVFLFADSDMLFVRPFDLASLASADGTVRLYRKPDGIGAEMEDHRLWCRNAAAVLGLPEPAFPCSDYINNLVSWRRDALRAMCERIEATTGRDWIGAIASRRAFSEYQLYGQFAEGVLGLAGHRPDALELCKTYWFDGAADLDALPSLTADLAEGQVAVGVQSFIGHPVEKLTRLFEAL